MNQQRLTRPGMPDLAYAYTPPADPALPVVVFCGGYASDMAGTKALYLEERCAARGQGYLRFDYRGHGVSGGNFRDGTIGLWLTDMLAVCRHAVPDDARILLVGSSMGGWIALRAAMELGDRVAGIVGIAAAPDFTQPLHDSLDAAQKRALEMQGYIEIPNEYGPEPTIFTAALFADGEDQGVLDRAPHYTGTVNLIQGMKDPDVPWQTAHRIKNAVRADGGVAVFLVENGDHRLSKPEELALIDARVRALSGLPE